jgi:hypothetical protein
VGDAGYFSEGNVKKCEANEITPYIAGTREKHHKSLQERFRERKIINVTYHCLG